MSISIDGETQSAIHTVGLTKYYGRHLGIEDVDLDVREGEVFGFLGPNGAGKSTTIRTILDEIRPTSGSATILGFDTHADSVEIRRHIGYIPGDLALYPNLTGMDTLQYFANMRGGVDWDFVDNLADRLDSDLSRKVGDLSTGNRQKIESPAFGSRMPTVVPIRIGTKDSLLGYMSVMPRYTGTAGSTHGPLKTA